MKLCRYFTANKRNENKNAQGGGKDEYECVKGNIVVNDNRANNDVAKKVNVDLPGIAANKV